MISDEVLAQRAALGCERSFELLEHRLADLRGWVCSAYFLPGADHADVLQEASIGLLKACAGFRSDRHASFRTFAELAMRRNVISAVITATRHKHLMLTHATSLDAPVPGGEDATLGESVADVAASAWEVLEHRGTIALLFNNIGTLTPFEQRALIRCGMNGEPYRAVGEEKAIDNALTRARRKLRAALELEDRAA